MPLYNEMGEFFHGVTSGSCTMISENRAAYVGSEPEGVEYTSMACSSPNWSSLMHTKRFFGLEQFDGAYASRGQGMV